MSRFDTRLTKLETVAGKIDERTYWRAVEAIQPRLDEITRQAQAEDWELEDIFMAWAEAKRELPPPPWPPATSEQCEADIQAMLRLINGYDDDDDADPEFNLPPRAFYV